jgi:Skp family chaperone for outer membrane proteins
MTRFRVLAALAGACALAGLGVAAAVPKGEKGKAKPPIPFPQKIALLDVSVLLESDPRVKAIVEESRKRAERVRKRRAEIAALQNRLKDFTPGSAEFREIAKEVVERTASLNTEISPRRKRPRHHEAAYYEAYQRILAEVRAYAKANRITAVLRFHSEPVDPDVPESVTRAINNYVIYREDGMDITPIILERLKRKSPE